MIKQVNTDKGVGVHTGIEISETFVPGIDISVI